MPRPFRICADTGIIEFDDSIYIEGECPQCHRRHSGAHALCDSCIEWNDPRNHEYIEETDYDLEREYQEWLEKMSETDESAKNIFDGTPDCLRME